MSPSPALPPWAPAGIRYAGFWIRVGANALDMLWMAAVNMAVVLLFEGPRQEPPGVGSVSAGISVAIVQSGSLLFAVICIGFWIWKGATPGKMMCRLRIVDETSGRTPTAWQCIGRYFLGVIVMAAAGIGYIWIAIDPRRQGWHDKIVRTLVVRKDHAA